LNNDYLASWANRKVAVVLSYREAGATPVEAPKCFLIEEGFSETLLSESPGIRNEGVAQWTERFPAKEETTGSTPVILVTAQMV
jgi:hypothetical protein